MQECWRSDVNLRAKLIASNSEIILSLLGPTKFWEIVRASRNIFIRANENNALVPKCYTSFWHEFENYLPDSNVVPCGESTISYRKINDSVIPDGENIKLKRKVMIDIGLNPVSSGMNSYHEILEDLGVERLDTLVHQPGAAAGNRVKVFVNGNWFGLSCNPDDLEHFPLGRCCSKVWYDERCSSFEGGIQGD
jgi:hypothetical protein